MTIVGGKLIIDRKRCNVCGICAQVCDNKALAIIGEIMKVSDVIAEIVRDKPFYEESQGGVTITGGEPTYQADFASALLKAAKLEGIGTAIETCGYASWPHLKQLLEYTDLILFDLKIIAAELSVKYIGGASHLILENLKKADSLNKPLYIRFPLIPGYTDSHDNLEAIARLVTILKNVVEFDILPFHQYGKHKYKSLGCSYMLEKMKPLQREDAAWIADFFLKRHLKIKLFGQ
jgi:pyruvate formate lyase activating enzyme